uniref:Membrane transport protein MMPL domain-containing protein n=1 Tax=Desulfobacca acetoxidans TaxID=60893 RepID=A0A7C3Z2N8_9BACT
MSRPFQLSSALVRVLFFSAWPVIVLSLLITAASIYYSLHHLSMRTSRADLVGLDLRLMRLSQDLDRQFGALDNLAAVVENTDSRRSIQFAEALAAELRKYPQHFSDLFYRVEPDKLKKWALLYLDREKLLELKEKFSDHQKELRALAADPSLKRFFQVVNEEMTSAMLGHLFTGFLEEKQEKEKIPDLGLLRDCLRQMEISLAGGSAFTSPLGSLIPGGLTDLSQEGYLFTDNDKYLLFLVTSRQKDYTATAEDLRLLRQTIDRVKERFPGIQVGVTGPGALEADEMTGAMADIELASLLSLVGQMGLMVAFFRSVRRTLVQGAVLFIGLCWTFGIAAVAVGHLNLLSIVFGPLLLGITVDFGIHWYARLEEEQGHAPRCTVGHLACTIKRASPGILYAALAAVVSVCPLIFTGFKGLEELGLIITLGILANIFAFLVLLPCLALVSERGVPGPLEVPCAGQPRSFLSIRWRRPFLIVAVGAVVTILGGISLFYVPFDLNPLHLQNPRTESVVWEQKLIHDSKYSTSYGAMVVCRPEDLSLRIQVLKKLESVSHVESILSFLPSHVEAKQRLAAELEPLVSGIHFAAAPPNPYPDPEELAATLGSIRFKLSRATESDWEPEDRPTEEQLNEVKVLLSQIITALRQGNPSRVAARLADFQGKFIADLRDKWETLQTDIKWAFSPPGLQDLPPGVRARFVSPEGNFLIRIFPSRDIWNPGPLEQFVRDLRTIDPDVAGDPVLLYVFTFAFRNACLWAAGISLLSIALLVAFLLRSLWLTVLALVPLLVGTSLTLSLMWLLEVPFNQANVLFLPLILGEAVEYGIIILVRWQQEPSARVITLPASTAKGVLLAALTTAVGFGSLMVSGHRGTFSLGLLSTVGSLSVLLAALSVLPALLRLLRERFHEEVFLIQTETS